MMLSNFRMEIEIATQDLSHSILDTMADGCVSKLCEKCKTSSTTSTLRQCDMVLCDDCNSIGSKYNEHLINKSFQYEQEHSTSEIEEDEGAMTGHPHHADEVQGPE